jgi:plasmid stabilization system protein ParE
MNYHVEITAQAKAEADEAYRWLFERSSTYAARWYYGLRDAIDSLKTHPNRCPLAPENEHFEEEIRQLLYGRRGGRYRVLFEIRGDTVYVLHVRHGARRALRADDVNDEEDQN